MISKNADFPLNPKIKVTTTSNIKPKLLLNIYTGVEINSLKSYPGKYLFRGAVINKTEIEKIKYNKKIGKLLNVIAFFQKPFYLSVKIKTKLNHFVE